MWWVAIVGVGAIILIVSLERKISRLERRIKNLEMYRQESESERAERDRRVSQAIARDRRRVDELGER